MKNIVLALAIAALVSGCWTFGETDYPPATVTAANGASSNLVLKVEGFAAAFTEIETVHGYSTVYTSGYMGWRHYHPGGFGTVHTYSYVPTVRPTDMFLKRAKDVLEDAGFVVSGASVPDYVVEVSFSGPYSDAGDACASWAWKLGTVFFCDYAAEGWTADLRIRDNRTGRVALHRTFEQRYETKVFGLIPLFGISSTDATSSSRIKGWCLSALTDRAVAETSAFLSSKPMAPAVPMVR